jgi:hypothetical protein
MPPRYTYWTIIVGGQPTAFRAASQEELLPTLKQTRVRQPDAVMKWFARGKLWNSPEEASAALRQERQGERGERRGSGWRPGGDHEDPRARFKVPRDVKRQRFADRLHREPPEGKVDRDGRPSRPSGERPFRPKTGRPARPHGDRPFSSREDRPFKPSGDRPFRPQGDRQFKPSGNRPFGPPRDRPFGPKEDRPSRPPGHRPDAKQGGPGRTDRPFRPKGAGRPPFGKTGSGGDRGGFRGGGGPADRGPSGPRGRGPQGARGGGRRKFGGGGRKGGGGGRGGGHR